MSKRSPKRTYTYVAIALGLLAFVALLWLGITSAYLSWLLAMTATTFALYGYDKMEAKLGGGRVPEIVLHALALAGGFLGGWLGMFVFNHKKRKREFWIVLIVSTILWIGISYVALIF
ncbi:MAG: DUF1294 domain-containing protein [Chloroflexi bacterium]|nr:DUF1294 domain-containing protein [Chloroflexota bacterium]